MKEMTGIALTEEVVAVGGGVTMGELCACEAVRAEAPAVAQAAALDLLSGVFAAADTVEQLLQRPASCGFTQPGAACLASAGAVCPAGEQAAPGRSVFGGVRTGLPACQSACPFGVEVPAVLELLRLGKLLEAQRTLLRDLPMAEVVCPLCGRCARACARGEQAVAADRVLKWLGGRIAQCPEVFFVPPAGDSEKWIALQGVTLCGLAAAYCLRRMGHHVAFLGSARPEELLAPWGEAGRASVEALKAYLANLRFMGVLFGKEVPAGRRFDLQLALQDEGGSDGLLFCMAKSLQTAKKINLDYGLKPYLEGRGSFCTFDSQGIERPPAGWQDLSPAGQEDSALQEAGRCLNCSCTGVCQSAAATALYMLEATIVTSERTLRARDYYAFPQPFCQLKAGERLLGAEIPRSGGYCCSCLQEGELTLCCAFLTAGGRLRDVRLVFGGAAPLPVRLDGVERMLKGRPLKDFDPAAEARAAMALLAPQFSLLKGSEGTPARMAALLKDCLAQIVQKAGA